MTGQGLGRLAAAIVAALVALLVLPAAAHAASGPPAGRVCVAYGSLDTAVAPPAGWDCSGRRASLEPERVFLRFALPTNGAAPEYATFRRAAFERLHLLVVAVGEKDATQVKAQVLKALRGKPTTSNEFTTGAFVSGRIYGPLVNEVAPQHVFAQYCDGRPKRDSCSIDGARLTNNMTRLR